LNPLEVTSQVIAYFNKLQSEAQLFPGCAESCYYSCLLMRDYPCEVRQKISIRPVGIHSRQKPSLCKE